jgi:hypothetical protein
MNLYQLHSNPEELDHHDKLSKKLDGDGNIIYRDVDGNYHRDDDQPAIIRASGVKLWYKHGKRHRGNDKPAIVYPHGTKYWYKNDQQHRDDNKPAVVFQDGKKVYFKFGLQYFPEE